MNELNITYILTCKSSLHDIKCPSYRNNKLKGASVLQNPKQQPAQQYSPKILTFDSREVQLISKVLELSKYHVKDLQNQDILSKIDKGLQILNKGGNTNQLKGASNNINSLDNIRKMFGLNNSTTNELKGASSIINATNNICQKKQILKNVINLMRVSRENR